MKPTGATLITTAFVNSADAVIMELPIVYQCFAHVTTFVNYKAYIAWLGLLSTMALRGALQL